MQSIKVKTRVKFLFLFSVFSINYKNMVRKMQKERYEEHAAENITGNVTKESKGKLIEIVQMATVKRSTSSVYYCNPCIVILRNCWFLKQSIRIMSKSTKFLFILLGT